jgi:hypothetical protein
VGKIDTLGFRDQAKHLSIAIETPWAASFSDLQGGFAVPIKEHDAGLPCWVFVGKLDSGGAVPFDVNHGHHAIGHNALDSGSSL